MVNPVNGKAGVTPAPPAIIIGRERLLGVPDVCEITGLADVTAAKLMKESGRCISLHRRLYVLESSFFAYLHEVEVTEPCTL